VRARSLVALAFAAASAASAGSCAEGVERLGDDCTPFKPRPCRCADGLAQGRQTCSRDGRSYTECAPCPENATQGAGGAAACGDGRLDAGEDCDDGNRADGDACPATCLRPKRSSGDTCEGLAPLQFNPGVAFQSKQNLSLANGDVTGSCGGEGGEVVFAFAPTASGTLALTLAPDDGADVVLYVRAGACDDEAAEPAGGCGDGAGDGAEEALRVPVEQGTAYFVFADLRRGGGSVTLSVRLEDE
jgi:cysteine-rich repeat protein